MPKAATFQPTLPHYASGEKHSPLDPIVTAGIPDTAVPKAYASLQRPFSFRQT